MSVNKLAKPLTVRPISASEFSAALWQPFRDATAPVPRHVKWGVAVSGGVDSMALAYLCKRMQDHDPTRCDFTAFVVDHCARTESTEESFQVIEMLEQLGLKSHRLSLTWPDHLKQPLKLTNFESKARELRFQALGRACASNGIRRLILGHHADDLAETALFRIVNGRAPPTLHHAAHIAECQGIPNVDNLLLNSPLCQPVRNAPMRASVISYPRMADRGIQIHKPLQRFGKDRLRTTCLQSKIPWVEDATNQDPTLTSRNAVRYLFQHHVVPKVLQKPALLQLVDRRTQQEHQAEKYAIACIKRMSGLLDTRTGVLRVDLPRRRGTSNERRDVADQVTTSDDVIAMINQMPTTSFALIGYLARMVQPQCILGAKRKKDIAQRIAKAMQPSNFEHTHITFASGEIQWTCIRRTAGWTLELSRQRPPAGKSLQLCKWSQENSEQWQLFDGRFWIKLKVNPESWGPHGYGMAEVRADMSDRVSSSKEVGTTEFEVRLLCEAGLGFFRKELRKNSKQSLRDFNSFLSNVATNKTCWTLPVLAPRGEDGIVIAFPTLDWCLPGVEKYIDWEIQYAHTFISRQFSPESEIPKVDYDVT